MSKYQNLGNKALAEQSSLLFSKKAEPGRTTPENRARSNTPNAGSPLPEHGVLGRPTVTSASVLPLGAEGRRQLRVKGEGWTGRQSKTRLQKRGAR